MKIYFIQSAVKRRYYISGFFFLLVAVAVFILRPVHYAAEYQNLLIYVFVLMLAALSLLRPKVCRLTLDRESLCFYDGLLGRVSIRLEQIRKIEWSTETRTRIYAGPEGRRPVKIPNVFSPEDTAEIFRNIQKRKSSIEIVRLDPPDRRCGPKASPEEDMKSEEHTEHD